MQDISKALVDCRLGKKISRDGWNASGQWVAYSPGFKLEPDRIFSDTIRDAVQQSGDRGVFRPYLMLRTADGSFVPWQPTVSDVLALDWLTVE